MLVCLDVWLCESCWPYFFFRILISVGLQSCLPQCIISEGVACNGHVPHWKGYYMGEPPLFYFKAIRKRCESETFANWETNHRFLILSLVGNPLSYWPTTFWPLYTCTYCGFLVERRFNNYLMLVTGFINSWLKVVVFCRLSHSYW